MVPSTFSFSGGFSIKGVQIKTTCNQPVSQSILSHAATTMQPKKKLDGFNRRDFMKTANSVPLYEAKAKEEERCLRNSGYVTLVPIVILLIIVIVTISSTLNPPDTIVLRAKQSEKCNIRLVESLPDGLNYSTNDPTFMSTYDAWNLLLDSAKSSVYIGSFYWTLRGADVINHTTASEGEAIFNRLLANSIDKKFDLRIAQSAPTQNEPDWDTTLLASTGAAQVRSVNFTRLLGGGVLHTKLWIIDGEHFYLGSANMDWRSLTQVKELGVLAQNCSALTGDILKIFEAYWLLGLNTSTIPNPWPKEFSTTYNQQSPMSVNFNEKFTMSAFLSSSPPAFSGNGRTNDVDAIINTILTAKHYVHIAVMDYFPLLIYTKKIQYWPYIDDALRKAAVENGVAVKMLISLWKHSNPIENYFLRSLTSISNAIRDVDIEIKRFIVPSNEDQEKIPYGRVNHNKYMVTDNTAYIGTSNWSGDYFTDTAGIGLVLKVKGAAKDSNFEDTTPPTIRDDLSKLFLRDWNSPYAVPFE